jgi:hypothetical protein
MKLFEQKLEIFKCNLDRVTLHGSCDLKIRPSVCMSWYMDIET